MIIQTTQQTEEEKFTQFMRVISSSINHLHEMMNTQHQNIFNQFWNSQYPTQKIVNTLGFEQSLKLFQLSSALQEILKADENYVELVPPKNVDFSTGKILITDKDIV